jgi:hypothetical protein
VTRKGDKGGGEENRNQHVRNRSCENQVNIGNSQAKGGYPGSQVKTNKQTKKKNNIEKNE